MARISKLSIQIGAETQGFRRGVALVQGHMQRFAQRSKQSLASVASSARSAQAGIRAMGAGVVKAAAAMQLLRSAMAPMKSLWRQALGQVNMGSAAMKGAQNTWQRLLRTIALQIEAFVQGVLPGFTAFATALGATIGGGGNMAQQLGQAVGQFLQVLGDLIKKALALFGIPVPALPPALPVTGGPLSDALKSPLAGSGRSIDTAFGAMAVTPLVAIQKKIDDQIKLQKQLLDVTRRIALAGGPLT